MALRGSLGDFGLVEALQMLAQGRKSGLLELSERSGLVRLWLANGELVRVARRSEAPDEGTLRALVGAELLGEAQLAAARVQSEQAGELTIETLVRGGSVDATIAEQLAQLVSRETLLSLLVLEEGQYAFEPSETPPVPLHAPLRLEPLMLRVLEDLDTYRLLRRRIPSPKRIYRPQGSLEAYLAMHTAVAATELRKKPALYDDAAAPGDAPADDGSTPGVGHSERLVFSLLDGERDVGKIVGLARTGELPVLRALAWLEDHQLAVLAVAGPEGHDHGLLGVPVRGEGLTRKLTAGALAACWLALALVLVGSRQIGHDAARLAIWGQAPQIMAWRGSRAEVARQAMLPQDGAGWADPWRHASVVCHEAPDALPKRPLE